MSRPYGSFKNKAISYVASHQGTTVKELADYLKIDEARAGTMLWSYHKSGALVRQKIDNARGYLYFKPPVKRDTEQTETQSVTLPDTSASAEVTDLQPQAQETSPVVEIQQPIVEVPVAVQSIPVSVPSTPIGEILDEVISTLAEHLARQVILRAEPLIAQKLKAVIESVATPPKQSFVPGAHTDAAKVNKKKVLIIGLLPSQVNLIQREYGSLLDITFLTADDSQHRVQSVAKHSDAVYTMISFISHKVTESIKSVNPRALNQVHGGVTDLRNKLLDYSTQP